jgi:hypothetical protein
MSSPAKKTCCSSRYLVKPSPGTCGGHRCCVQPPTSLGRLPPAQLPHGPLAHDPVEFMQKFILYTFVNIDDKQTLNEECIIIRRNYQLTKNKRTQPIMHLASVSRFPGWSSPPPVSRCTTVQWSEISEREQRADTEL